jgi:hypothetical protein
MRTPDGKMCPEYYQDFARGRSVQECRLANRNGQKNWHPKDCALCNLPEILQANASEHLQVSLEIKAGFLGLGRRVIVNAYCSKHQAAIENPFTGCAQCNAERPGLSAFQAALDTPE